MKRLTLTILILGILGFSLLAITNSGYGEDPDRLGKEIALVYGQFLRANKPELAAAFKDEAIAAARNMPDSNIATEIAKIESSANRAGKIFESYQVIDRDREKIAERERYTEGTGGSSNNSNGASTSGGAITGLKAGESTGTGGGSIQ